MTVDELINELQTLKHRNPTINDWPVYFDDEQGTRNFNKISLYESGTFCNGDKWFDNNVVILWSNGCVPTEN